MENLVEKKVTCPKCLGTGEIFNGRFVKKCELCKYTGFVSKEMEESYIDEQLPYE